MIVFDLDGTLSDDSHRIHLIQGTLRADPAARVQWALYFERCGLDAPHQRMIELFRTLRFGRERVEIWTGRDGGQRAQTERWLSEHVFGNDMWTRQENRLQYVPLIMRPAGSVISDIAFKTELLHDARRRLDPVSLVFEDRAKMAKWWRSMGVVCCDVAGTEDWKSE